MAYKLLLIMTVEVRRRLTAAKRRLQWTTDTQATTGIHWLLNQLDTHTACLHIKPASLAQLYATVPYGPTWWHGLQRAPTLTECDTQIKALRSLMHGRHRTDLRRSINKKVALREHKREQGKLRPVLTSIFGVLGGRKYQTALNLDVVKNASGTIATSPTAVHAMITEHFKQWYAQPPTTNPIHTDPDRKRPLLTLDAFQAAVRHTGVPDWASATIYDAITNTPDRADTEIELTAIFDSPHVPGILHSYQPRQKQLSTRHVWMLLQHDKEMARLLQTDSLRLPSSTMD